MRVTAIMATFNCGATVEAALQSMLAQTERLEIVVIDGGSTDGTLEILERYRTHIDALVSEPDDGVYDALNKGLRIATGEYVYVLGSDDVLHDENAIARLLSAEGADVIYGDVVVKFASGHRRHTAALPLSRFKYMMPFSHQAALVKRTLALEHPFGRSAASDYRQLLKLYLSGVRFRHVDTCVAVYAMGGISDRGAVRSTIDRMLINQELRGWRSLDVAPFYAAQTAVCWLKPRLVRALRRLRRAARGG